MKVTYNWLKEYVEIKISPQVLADKLTMAGLEVISLKEFADDWVFEIEVTTNRPDWLSVIGIAREVAAITGKKLKLPQLEGTRHKTQDTKFPLEIKIEDKVGCPRYTGRIIDNVKIGPSPEWMKKRLEAVGVRPVNNIVDITNYLLFETGQPMHAFDFDKINEGKIIVRRAGNKEKVITIDGEERILDESMLVIADSKGAVAVAGIMGGKYSEVSRATKTVLLESACFDPVTVRKGSRKLMLSTDSSYRFERGVNPDTVLTASERAAALIKELAVSPEAKAEESVFKDAGRKTEKAKTISFNCSTAASVLGRDVKQSEIKKILENLGFRVKPTRGRKFEVSVPYFRRDISQDVDLIEEIARLSGYEHIPLSLPALDEPEAIVMEPEGPKLKDQTKDMLLSLGFNEIITYSLISRSLLEGINCPIDKNMIKITNPLSAEQELLRPQLAPSILSVISHNAKRKIEDLRLFELASVYTAEEGKVKERPALGICLTGKRYSDWKRKTEELDFYDLKGTLETLLARLGLENIIFEPKESNLFSSVCSLAIKLENKLLGFVGEIDEVILKNFDLNGKVYLAEFDLDTVFALAGRSERYIPVARHPSVIRDISFMVDTTVSYNRLLKFFREDPSGLIREVNLIDVYAGKNIPPGKKSLTFSLKYQSAERTLRDEEVDAIESEIRRKLTTEFAAELR